MADDVSLFVVEVTRFREWVLSGADRGPEAAREALVRITALYLTGLSLPRTRDDDLESMSEPLPRRSVYKEIHAAVGSRLPFQFYGEVSNPMMVPPEEPSVGDLADDIADIFADVDAGFQLYEADRRTEAAREWCFNMRIHWGGHATSAIRALHCFLAAKCPEMLSKLD